MAFAVCPQFIGVIINIVINIIIIVILGVFFTSSTISLTRNNAFSLKSISLLPKKKKKILWFFILIVLHGYFSYMENKSKTKAIQITHTPPLSSEITNNEILGTTLDAHRRTRAPTHICNRIV